MPATHAWGFRHSKARGLEYCFSFKIRLSTHHKRNALWVQVLRSKYKFKEHVPVSLPQGNCSAIWRGIARVWPLLRANLRWDVGIGEAIRSWEDS